MKISNERSTNRMKQFPYQIDDFIKSFVHLSAFGKWEVLKKNAFFYKLSSFVINKINQIDFIPKK